MTKTCLIYTRVSRDDSGEGASNERQEEACRNLAAARQYEVVSVEADISISAYSGKTRPAWGRVLKAMEAREVDVVIAWHLDRLTRSIRDLEDLIDLSEQTGVALTTVNGDLDLTNDSGRTVARILGAIARGEGERKSARQKLANRQRAAEGLTWPSGFRAFGYSLDGAVIEEEATHIREAAALALSGEPMRAIARSWNEAGLRSVHSKGDALGWTSRGVKSLLVNPRYAGIATYRGETLGVGQWKPLFDETTHARLKARLNDPSRRTRSTGAGRTPETLLSGIATCIRCGETVNARTSNKTPAYGCTRGCIGTPRAEADRLVLETFEQAIRQHGPRAVLGLPHAPELTETEDVEPLIQQRRIANAAFLRGDLPGDEYEDLLSQISSRLAQIERQAEAPRQIFGRITRGADEYLRGFAAAPLAARRADISTAVEVVFKPKGRGRRNVPIEEQIDLYIQGPAGEMLPADAIRAASPSTTFAP